MALMALDHDTVLTDDVAASVRCYELIFPPEDVAQGATV